MFYFPPTPAEPARTSAQYFALLHHLRAAHKIDPVGDRNRVEAAHAEVHREVGAKVRDQPPHPIVVVMSGGQTGVDRDALDWALAAGFPCGGFCPAQRLAEDGRIPDRYPLMELASRTYPPRTRKNIATSDGTLIFAPSPRLEGGTALTAEIAGAMGKPLLIVSPGEKDSAERVRRWASEQRVFWVNVAGPRASKGVRLMALVHATLTGAFEGRAPFTPM